ncbi:MAG TPA: tetratricopeptide repeat protein [Gemmatimonadales bacterium]|nr:tetratricopeptide repeat protein [Gemmatimonadales bacterium]
MIRLVAHALALCFVGAAPAQRPVPESALVRRPNPFAALGGRHVIIRHVTPFRKDSGYTVVAGDSVGRIDSFPPRLSRRHDGTLAQADSLYNQKRYADAAALLATAYRDEPDNPFVLNAYGRTLFRIDDQRDKSFEVYQRLITLLDRRGGTSDSAISVDAWFGEAYWKIASLYLDRREFQSAAFEISRFLATTPPRDPRVLGQVLDYLVEAYVRLGDDDMARLWGARALRLDPTDAYALGLLYELGPRAAARAPTDALACRVTSDSSPALGAYSLYREDQRWHCFVDRADDDGTFAPCLRIGWIYVGLARPEAERRLGKPWRSMRHEPDGNDIVIYVVFHDTEHQRGAYYAVEYESAGGRQIVETVQLTQDPPPLPLDLACLQLGDSSPRVARQLGRADRTEPFDDEANQLRGERWEYRDAPVSIEIVDGKVYSLKVWRPEGIPARERRLTLSPP